MTDTDTLEYQKIKFMEWGIINKHNLTEENIEEIPEKNVDLLVSNPTDLGNKYYSQYCYNSPIRNKRPNHKREERTAKKEVFQPIINGEDWSINVALGTKPIEGSIFSKQPIKKNLREHKAITVINKYPAGVRILDTDKKTLKKIGKYNKMINLISLVTQYPKTLKKLDDIQQQGYTVNQDYHQKLEETPKQDLTELLQSMSTGIKQAIKEANQKGHTEIPIFPFFNIGSLVGGSQRRLHSQVHIDLNNDGHGPKYETLFKNFKRGCRLCKSKHKETKRGRPVDRQVYSNESFDLWFPNMQIRNYSLRFAPKQCTPSITDLNEKEFEDLADVLITAFKGLNHLGTNPHRNIVFYALPSGYKTPFHFWGQITPFEQIGGIEMTDDLRISSINLRKVSDEFRKYVKTEGI